DLGYISSPPSTQANNVLGVARRFGAGGTIGYMAGGFIGAGVGAGVEELMRNAVSTETGRRIVKYLAKEGRGKINAFELKTMLGKAIAGAGSAVAGASQPAGENINMPNEQ